MSMSMANQDLPFINQKANILGIILSFQCIAIIAVAVRIYYRARIAKALGGDDVFILLAVILNTAGIICLAVAAAHGLGRHFLTIPFADIKILLKAYYATFITYAGSTAFVKISLTLQFLRVFDSGYMRYICITLLTITALWGTASTIVAVFPCWPIRGGWDFSVRTKCWAFSVRDTKTLVSSNESHAVINMALDIMILLTAVKLLFAPQILKKQRVGLVILLVMGTLVTTCSVARLVTMVDTKAGTSPAFDPTYYAALTVVLSAVEVQGAIVCASIPFFWPVFSQIALGKIVVVQEIQIQSHPIGGYERDEAGSFPNKMQGRRGTGASGGTDIESSRSGSHKGEEFKLEHIEYPKQPHQGDDRRANVQYKSIGDINRNAR